MIKKYENGYIGFTKDYIFLTKMDNIVESDLTENTIKKSLGEGSVLIKKADVVKAITYDNAGFGVQIEPKGLGDVIGVMTGSLGSQLELVADVAAFLEKKSTHKKVELGIFKKMFGSLFLASAAALITYLLYFATNEAIATGANLSGEYSGKKGILANIAEFSGPNGVLVLGGIVVIFFILRGVKKSKEKLFINEIHFQ